MLPAAIVPWAHRGYQASPPGGIISIGDNMPLCGITARAVYTFAFAAK